MKHKFIEKPYQQFIQIQHNNTNTIETSFEFNEHKLPQLLKLLKNYCYLISNPTTKYFDIVESFYDTSTQKYTRLQRLNRPKQITLKTQSIHTSTSKKHNYFIIKYTNFHKTKQLKFQLKQANTPDWKINASLQKLNMSFPYIQKQRTESFSRIILYQPHSKTKVHIDFDKHIQSNSTETNIEKIKITIISQSRNDKLIRHIKKIISQR
jgi:hypothetical protein